MNFSTKLKAARNEKSMTQLELAKTLHVALSVIGDIESGRRPPSKITAVKLAEFFNTAVDYWLDEQAEYNYVEKRDDFASLKEVIASLKDKRHIVNGIPTDEGWDLIKDGLMIDLKFMHLKGK